MTDNKAITLLDLNKMFSGAVAVEMDKKFAIWMNEQLFSEAIADVVQVIGVQTITDLPESPIYVIKAEGIPW